jgi:uncharacterized protein YndB with AHSA1/START domain
VSPTRASVRFSTRIERPAHEVWGLAGDPARLHEWFPGIVACQVEGDQRVVTMASGLAMPERLLTVDGLQRRLQYRITAPMFTEHLGTIDVFELDDATSFVVYSTDADPATLALVIGGAAGNALDHLRELLEEGQ